MNIIEPQLAALATAKGWFLDRNGLTESDVSAALAEIFQHRVDYADLYFQYARSESWSLEEGIVKSGSFDIEEGVGVRAVTGDKQAFAYSDDISRDAMLKAARATRGIARQGSARSRPQGRNAVAARRPLHVVCAARSARVDGTCREGRAARTARAFAPARSTRT